MRSAKLFGLSFITVSLFIVSCENQMGAHMLNPDADDAAQTEAPADQDDAVTDTDIADDEDTAGPDTPQPDDVDEDDATEGEKIDEDTVDDVPDDGSDNGSDEDAGVESDTFDGDTSLCRLDTAFYDDMPTDWTAWLTIRMIGLINPADVSSGDVSMAFLADLSAKIGGIEMDIGDNLALFVESSDTSTGGSDVPAILAEGLGNVHQISTQIGTMYDYYIGYTYVPIADLQAWKAQLDTYGAPHALFTVDGATRGVIIHQLQDATTVRRVCYAGISAFNAEISAYEGAMAFCLDGNTTFAADEIMKQMYYVKILDKETDILAVLNDGLDESDPDYVTDLCTCYSTEHDVNGDHIEMSCDDLENQMNGNKK